MTDLSIEEQMNRFISVSDIVAKAMSRYASSVTSTKWPTAPFAFEADFIVSEIMRGGYEIIPRTDCAQEQPPSTETNVNETRSNGA